MATPYASKLRGIPKPAFRDTNSQNFALAVKQNLELITGQLGGSIPELPSTATTAEIAAALNIIIRRLNGS